MIRKALFLILCSGFYFGFSQENSDSTSTKVESSKQLQPKSAFTIKNKLRVGFGVGASKRFGNLDQVQPDLKFYYNDLKQGGYYQFNADYGSFEKINIGFTYGVHSAQKFLPNETFTDSLGNVSSGNLSDRIRIKQFLIRISSKKYLGSGENVVVWSSVGGGQAFYSQESVQAEKTFSYTGKTIVFGVSAGIDLLLSKHFSIGAEFNAVYGVLSKAIYDDDLVEEEQAFDETEKINLSKLELGIGCRYYF